MEIKKNPFGRRRGGYVLDLKERGKTIKKPKGVKHKRDKKLKDVNRDLLKFIKDKTEREYMESIINNEEILDRVEHTSESLLKYLQLKYTKKVSGKDFKPNDIYQYIYRGYLPKQYGGNKLTVKSKVQGIVIIKLEPTEEGVIQYKERRGRKKIINLPGITD